MANDDKNDNPIDINRISLLNDDPRDEDELDGSSHNKVAEALKKIITDEKQKVGYAIGLEGAWGSGKSTVISIAKKLIKEKYNNKYLFFTFDAWARQGDPVRRSFIELLMDYLDGDDINLINKNDNKWKEIRETIKSKAIDEVDSKKSKVTRFGKMIGIYGLVYPFLVLFSTKILEDWYTSDIIFYILVCSLGFPSLLLGIEKILQKVKKENIDSFIPSLKLEHHTIDTSFYIKQKDTTTIEFNDFFIDLIKELKNDQKLIIVLDNLDRLPPEDIKLIWSTMRNFFSFEHDSKIKETLKDVYLIVPYDRKYITNVFSDNYGNFEFKNDNNYSFKSRSEAGFIEKTFDIIFNVSNPIRSDWKNYFEKYIGIAFDDQLSKNQKTDLYKLFQIKHQEDQKPITPRRIKKFINSLVVQVIEWENEIPIKYIGMYLLYRNEIQFSNSIQSNWDTLDKRSIRYLQSEDWKLYLIAIHYKIEPEIAKQDIFPEYISNFLVHENIDKINEIGKTSWFEVTLNIAIENNLEDWLNNDPVVLSRVATTLAKLKLNKKYLESKNWSHLAHKTNDLKTIRHPNKNIGDGFAIILSNIDNEYYISETATNFFERTANEIEKDTEIAKFAKDFVDYINILYKIVSERLTKNKANDLLKKVTLPNKPEFLIYFSSLIHKENSLNLKYFKNIVHENKIYEETIDQFLKEGKETEIVYYALVGIILADEIHFNWERFINTIYERIRQDFNSLNDNEVEMLLKILIYFKFNEIGNAKEKINQLQDQGILILLIQKVDDNNDTVPLILLEYIRRYPNVENISHRNTENYGNNSNQVESLLDICRNPSENEELVKNITIYACKYNYFQIVLNALYSNNDEYQIFNEIAAEMIEDECINGINIHDTFKKNKLLNFLNDYELSNKFILLIDRLQFEIEDIEDISSINPEFLDLTLKYKSSKGEMVKNIIKEEFKSYDTDRWIHVIKNNKNLIDILIVLVNNNNIGFLKSKFHEAIKNISEKYLKNELSLSIELDKLNEIPKALNGNIRPKLYKDLLSNILIHSNNKDPFIILSMIDMDKIENSFLKENSNKFLENIITPFLKKDKRSLEWIVENKKQSKLIYTNSNENNRNYFDETLLEQYTNEDKKDSIKIIAKELKIDLNSDENENVED